jgi:hypothetical protein
MGKEGSWVPARELFRRTGQTSLPVQQGDGGRMPGDLAAWLETRPHTQACQCVDCRQMTFAEWLASVGIVS